MVQYFLWKPSQAQFFVKYCIQKPFKGNVTALIKMWCFLEGVSSTTVEKKKVKQKPVPYMDQDVVFFRRLFAAFNRKKKVMQAGSR